MIEQPVKPILRDAFTSAEIAANAKRYLRKINTFKALGYAQASYLAMYLILSSVEKPQWMGNVFIIASIGLILQVTTIKLLVRWREAFGPLSDEELRTLHRYLENLDVSDDSDPYGIERYRKQVISMKRTFDRADLLEIEKHDWRVEHWLSRMQTHTITSKIEANLYAERFQSERLQKSQEANQSASMRPTASR